MKRRLIRSWWVSGVSAGILLSAWAAGARVEERLSYTKTQSYRSALRFLRVDHGYPVIEQDPDSGYLLFEYPLSNSGVTQGSIEVVERADSVALVVQLPKMPSYHERLLIEGLVKKLRADYGVPPSRNKPEDRPKDSEDRPKRKPPEESEQPGTKNPQQTPSPNQKT